MFGPHFSIDLIRLARKGWPTLLRVVYLSVLLLGLTIMYRTTGALVHPSDFAARAQGYADILVGLQYVLVILFLPVYIASAIAQEKENRTLEIVFLTFLTDRELVLGKFGARMLHLGAIMLAGYPLLIFMHLWGNVPLDFLLYHELNTLLLLLTGGSICILISTQSAGTFQAITRSYSWLALLGVSAMLLGAGLPRFISEILFFLFGVTGPAGRDTRWYWTGLALLTPVYLLLTFFFLGRAIALMRIVRREEARRPLKTTAAFSLAENRPTIPHRRQRRAPVSTIHPLALPLRGSALFWKECLKDGTSWSLRFGWLGYGLLLLLAPALWYRLADLFIDEIRRTGLGAVAYSFTYTSYFLCVAAYALVVIFQTTLCVAGEREQDTLVFLQLIPEDSRAILFFKWLGPFWRNWPILAIGYLGVFLGLACGLYSLGTALVLCLLPWPFLIMLSLLALCLSVLCRRVLFANICLIGFILLLVVGHIVGAGHIGIVFPYYVAVLFESRLGEYRDFPWTWALILASAQQAAFLLMAFGFGFLAFWRFERKA